MSQENAEQKREQIDINHADSPPWQMEDADSMVEKVKGQKLRQVIRKSNR